MVIALFCIAVLQLAVATISEEIAALACLALSSWIFAALSVGCGRAIKINYSDKRH
jgi:hypothetical protein